VLSEERFRGKSRACAGLAVFALDVDGDAWVLAVLSSFDMAGVLTGADGTVNSHLDVCCSCSGSVAGCAYVAVVSNDDCDRVECMRKQRKEIN
jgi:hypothetical protein